jgi:hypothetical protein
MWYSRFVANISLKLLSVSAPEMKPSLPLSTLVFVGEAAVVYLINDFARRFHNVDSTGRVRMAAQRNLVFAYWKVQLFASHCYDCRILDLASDMLLYLFGIPCPMHGEYCATSHSQAAYFFFRSITSVLSLLYLTSPYSSATKGRSISLATSSCSVPASPKTVVPLGTPA